MTTYNTGNPIGSKDPRDLYDNAENLDEAVNTRTAESWDDRFGVARKTWWGMEQDFQQFLINSGYENIGDYAAGLEITARNQIFWRDGELYRAGAVLELPYTTTGDWGTEEGLFVAVGDAALRQELASPMGAEIVNWEIEDGAGSVSVASTLMMLPCSIWNYSSFAIRRGSENPNDWDWTPSFVEATRNHRRIYFPAGEYELNDIRQTSDFLYIQGAGRGITSLKSDSVLLRNYDSEGNQYTGLIIEDLDIVGPYENPDNFEQPSNSWASESGLDKDLSSSIIGIVFHKAKEGLIRRVNFNGWHIGVDIHAGTTTHIDNCEFVNGKIGIRTGDGTIWGDVNWKSTTMRFRYNNFKRLWVGMYLHAFVDGGETKGNIFEPVNTAQYVFQSGSVRGTVYLSDYFERCYEGILIRGGSTNRIDISNPYFAGVPGNFWGYGKSILVKEVGVNGRINIVGNARGGGGIGIEGSTRFTQVVVDDRGVSGELLNNSLYIRNEKNNPICRDPFFSRGVARSFDYQAGITAVTRITEGGREFVRFTGSGQGLAFNGLRFLYTGQRAQNVPLRVRVVYRYNGGTSGFQPIGVAVGSSIYGPTVSPSPNWVTYEGSWDDISSNAFVANNAQGGFSGSLDIAEFYVSEGYGFANSYEPSLTYFTSPGIPAVASSQTGDMAINSLATQQKGWIFRGSAWEAIA